MFSTLAEKLESSFRALRSRGKLSESDIDKALDEIRDALLEADVNLGVVKKFCETVKQQSKGSKILKSLSPAQTVIKFVHDELIAQMGKAEELNLRFAPPVVIMLVGLQGSGKTTTCGKLAKYLVEEHKRAPLLVPADVYRPAAIDQLKTLGKQLHLEVFPSTTSQSPIEIAQKALDFAQQRNLDTVILDTAGRLQIDSELMEELIEIAETVDPHEILFVADAMTGQEAVNVATGFDSQLDFDGIVLTKLDGDARGGAALSMRAVTGKPIKFIGVGEKLDGLERFHPDRIATRILGQGDILSFIEKASKQVKEEDVKKLQKKIKKNEFSLEDFLSQLNAIRGMGSMSSLMQMMPGMGKVANQLDDDKAENELKHIEAMILSMTPQERKDYSVIDGSRKRRIAKGSGTSVEELNRLLKQFTQMRKVMKKMSGMGAGAMKGLGSLGGMLGRGKRPKFG